MNKNDKAPVDPNIEVFSKGFNFQYGRDPFGKRWGTFRCWRAGWSEWAPIELTPHRADEFIIWGALLCKHSHTFFIASTLHGTVWVNGAYGPWSVQLFENGSAQPKTITEGWATRKEAIAAAEEKKICNGIPPKG